VITIPMLRALPGLQAYSDQDLSALVGASTERTIAPGMAMCKEGEPGRSCFVLVAGEAIVVRATPAGERQLTQLAPGAIVGQIALVDRGPRSASIRARTTCLTLELGREKFEELLSSHTPLALKFHENIAVAGIRQLRAATERLMGVIAEREARLKAPPSVRGPKPVFGPTPSKPAPPVMSGIGIHPTARPQAAPPPPPPDDDEAEEKARDTLSYIRAAATHWELSLDELDDMKVVAGTNRVLPPKP
jgi:CRP-like cAMP-binding protein